VTRAYLDKLAQAHRRLHSRKERHRLRKQAATARAAREALIARAQDQFLATR